MINITSGQKIALATHNQGKLAELRAMLAPYNIEVVSAGELNLPEPEENGGSFEANALIKAQFVAQATGLPALADDSGLCITALGGWPAVDTATWTKQGREGLQAINARLGDDRRAQAICMLALALPDGENHTFSGIVEGTLVWPPRGESGFGYDPIFVPQGHTTTYAEMGKDAKNSISHRTLAMQAFVTACLAPQPEQPAAVNLNKAMPVILRQIEGKVHILAFHHPLAGKQLVKGSIKDGETSATAALRELAEESGITEAEATRGLGVFESGYKGQIWVMHQCDTNAQLPDTWVHYAQDDGGHLFNFFWQPLMDDEGEGWHPVFQRALAFIRDKVTAA